MPGGRGDAQEAPRARRAGRQGLARVAVDLRGHGDSEWAADGDYTLDAFAGDVLAISQTLGSSPALVGASLGGVASLAAIGEHPDENVARDDRSCRLPEGRGCSRVEQRIARE